MLVVIDLVTCKTWLYVGSTIIANHGVHTHFKCGTAVFHIQFICVYIQPQNVSCVQNSAEMVYLIEQSCNVVSF